MNKILVKDYLKINDIIGEITSENKSIILDIFGTNKLYLYNNVLNNIDLNVADNRKLDIFIYSNKLTDITININQNNDSIVNFNYSFINYDNSNVQINNNIRGNNNISNFIVRNISKRELSKIEVCANIIKNSKNNEVYEKINGITDGGNILVKPDIICDSFETIANHSSVIGYVNRDELHYLMSKGLEIDTANKLICNGFILNNMDKYMQEKILNGGGGIDE